MDSTAYWRVAGIGVTAGLRALTAPAAVSWAAHTGRLPLTGTGLAFLGSLAASRTLTGLAAGELVSDKLPSTPNRTEPVQLAARLVSGGLCGAAVCAAYRKPLGHGVLIGGVAAVVGAFVGYHLRHQASQGPSASPMAVALVEDTIAISGAAVAVAT